MTTPTDLVVHLAGLLEWLRIPYHVGGSLASSWYGRPRATADIDVVIEADAARLDALASALEHDFYVSRDGMAEALAQRSSFNAISLDSPFKIDFFILGSRDFDREEFRRAVPRPLGPSGSPQVRFKSPEDMILRKLEWFRARGGTSDQQWRDVLGILVAMHGHLDEGYLDRWAAELGLSDLLARARGEAAEP